MMENTLVKEASEMGWPPGHWPVHFEYVLNNKKMLFKRISHIVPRLTRVLYACEDKLFIVLND